MKTYRSESTVISFGSSILVNRPYAKQPRGSCGPHVRITTALWDTSIIPYVDRLLSEMRVSFLAGS